jgi:N-acetylglutamate synthase-like GNAT family acetyltransferase
MKIRKFKEKDAKKVSYLIIKAQDVLKGIYPKKVREDFIKKQTPANIIKKSKKRDFYVAVEGNKILGVIGIKKDEVKTVFVNPRYHKRGIARKLMNKIISIAKKRKIKKLWAGSTPYAEDFYKKMGFKRLRKVRWSINNRKFNIIKMEKKL